MRRNYTRGTLEAVRNGTVSRGPRNQKNCVGSSETIFLVNRSEIVLLWIVASMSSTGQVKRASLPHFKIPPELFVVVYLTLTDPLQI